MRSRNEVETAIDQLETARYSVETQARIEALYWVLEVIESDHCPPGAADDDRLRGFREGQYVDTDADKENSGR